MNNEDKLFSRHMDMVDAINIARESGDESGANRSEVFREGFLEAVRILYGSRAAGSLIMDADMRQMERGYEGPMCGGVKL